MANIRRLDDGVPKGGDLPAYKMWTIIHFEEISTQTAAQYNDIREDRMSIARIGRGAFPHEATHD